MAKVVGTDSDLLGNLPESPDRGKREAEAARLIAALEGLNLEDPAVRELAARFQEQARFVGGPKAEVGSGLELTTLNTLKANYDKSPQLHNGVTWEDAEKVLTKSPESVAKLAKLIARGGEPTVTGEENGEIMFDEVSADCAGPKNIVYDKAAQEGITCNGNAVDIAAELGVKPIAPKRYKALKGKVEGLDVNTWSWVLTDEATRKRGFALDGSFGIVDENSANSHDRAKGVRCSLGVKKA